MTGDIVIHIDHTSRKIVEAQASELTLVRSDSTNELWYVPETEVERLAAANGIPKASVLDLSEGEWLRTMLAGVGIVVLAVVAVFVVSWTRRSRKLVKVDD